MASSFSPLRGILLQPIIPAALLVAGWRYPQEARGILSQITKDVVNFDTLQTVLKTFLAVGVVYRINKYLERQALNNYVTDNTWDWSREIVLVTGGSSGIGAAIVQQFSERNVKVVILDIAPPPSSSKTPRPSTTHFYKVDITSTEAIKATAKQIRDEVGSPTVVINNAGIGSGQLILDESEEVLERTIAINLVAHFKMAKEFLPYMIEKNHGHIVTVASMASFLAMAGNASYSATKVGVLAFHEGLASELKSRYGAPKVRTTIVHPMWTRTPLTASLLESPEWKKDPQILLGPEQVASAVVAQVLKGESAQLILPPSLNFVSTIRGWPHWVQTKARDRSAGLLVTPAQQK